LYICSVDLTTGGVKEIHDSSFLKIKIRNMNWKKLEKHNVIDIVRRESLLEFTKEQILRCVENTRKNGFLYYSYNIENVLQELVNEGNLGVYYISVKVEPLQYSYRKILDNKVGSKSLAVYKSLKAMRNERIEEILK